MIDIFEVLKQNKKETIDILKKVENNMIEFAKWNDKKKCYVTNIYHPDRTEEDFNDEQFVEDMCPWIRMDNISEMVVAIKLNKEKDNILLLSVQAPDIEATESEWYGIDCCDDISEWAIYNEVGFVNDNIGF